MQSPFMRNIAQIHGKKKIKPFFATVQKCIMIDILFKESDSFFVYEHSVMIRQMDF